MRDETQCCASKLISDSARKERSRLTLLYLGPGAVASVLMQHKSRHRARRVAGEGNLRIHLLHEELGRRLRPQPDCPAAGAGASEKRLALKGHLELDARRES